MGRTKELYMELEQIPGDVRNSLVEEQIYLETLRHEEEERARAELNSEIVKKTTINGNNKTRVQNTVYKDDIRREVFTPRRGDLPF